MTVVYSGHLSHIGGDAGWASFDADGSFQLNGTATAFEDLRVEGLSARTGVVAPTTEVGFRGDNAYLSTNLVHNQADELQFAVQMPHGWAAGTPIYPHVHFAPWIANEGAGAARFILAYYVANVDVQFPSSPATYTMTKTWSGDQQWVHLLALNATPITTSGWTLSSILKCRLYRDNTVANNLAGRVALLYFDIHVEMDAFGSRQEYIK